jgi:hypothetical protein
LAAAPWQISPRNGTTQIVVENDRDKALAKALVEQKRLVAGDLFEEAWQAGARAGIEAELLAEAMVRGAVAALTQSCGRAASERLVARLSQLDSEGRLPSSANLH